MTMAFRKVRKATIVSNNRRHPHAPESPSIGTVTYSPTQSEIDINLLSPLGVRQYAVKLRNNKLLTLLAKSKDGTL